MRNNDLIILGFYNITIPFVSCNNDRYVYFEDTWDNIYPFIVFQIRNYTGGDVKYKDPINLFAYKESNGRLYEYGWLSIDDDNLLYIDSSSKNKVDFEFVSVGGCCSGQVRFGNVNLFVRFSDKVKYVDISIFDTPCSVLIGLEDQTFNNLYVKQYDADVVISYPLAGWAIALIVIVCLGFAVLIISE